jgi:hypothetical protein
MRVPMPYLHTAHVYTLADEVSVTCLNSNFFLFREAVILSLVRNDLLRGFADLILVSVFAFFSFGTTSDWFCSMKFSLIYFSFLTK